MDTVYVGASRKVIQDQLLDPTTSEPLVFGTSPTVTLIGTSLTLPDKPISVVGVIHDVALAVCWWTSAGTILTLSDLGGKSEAVYTCQVKLEDGNGIDFGDPFQIRFAAPVA